MKPSEHEAGPGADAAHPHQEDGLAALLLATMSDAVLRCDVEGRITALNPAAERMFGRERASVLGRSPDTLYEPSERDALHAGLRAALRSGRWEGELPVRHGDGTAGVVETTIVAQRDAQGTPVALLLVHRDAGSARAAALHERESRFRLVAHATSDIVYDRIVGGEETFRIETLGSAFGYDLARVDPDLRWWTERIHPDDLARVSDTLERALAGSATDVSEEYRFRRSDGSYATVLDRGHILRDAAGRAVRVVGAMIDSSERVQLEGQLRQAHKMEAVGRLAGGIAHDMNNRLMVISTRAQFALKELAATAPEREHLEKIGEAAALASTLTRQLLTFSRRQQLEPRLLALNDLVAGLEPLLRKIVGEEIVLASELAPNLWPVHADPGQLEHALVHLALNAQDAMPDGGRLSVTTANAMLDEAFAQRCPGVTPGPHVVLSVSDTGVGMDTTVLERAFEPFFTTKSFGSRSGLGLSTVYGIVQQSGGVVRAESEPGQGTTIRVYLPRARGARGTPASPLGAISAPRAEMATILLVEGEEEVRAILRRFLQRDGHRVLEARDGPEALMLAEIHGGPLHLLITEAVMPEMSGRALAERLAERHRGLRALFVSGHPPDALAAHGVTIDDHELLTKPFDGPTLTRRVRVILGSAATP